MNITKDIRPLTEFKRDTSRFVADLRESGRPTVLTINGKPELVIMDARAWQDVQDEIEYAQAVAGIRKGLAEADRGLGADVDTVFRRLRKRSAK
jgi:PHD/YefM family antitoxin component YafN of YafNO toxin-antitoxin module